MFEYLKQHGYKKWRFIYSEQLKQMYHCYLLSYYGADAITTEESHHATQARAFRHMATLFRDEMLRTGYPELIIPDIITDTWFSAFGVVQDTGRLWTWMPYIEGYFEDEVEYHIDRE